MYFELVAARYCSYINLRRLALHVPVHVTTLELQYHHLHNEIALASLASQPLPLTKCWELLPVHAIYREIFVIQTFCEFLEITKVLFVKF